MVSKRLNSLNPAQRLSSTSESSARRIIRLQLCAGADPEEVPSQPSVFYSVRMLCPVFSWNRHTNLGSWIYPASFRVFPVQTQFHHLQAETMSRFLPHKQKMSLDSTKQNSDVVTVHRCVYEFRFLPSCSSQFSSSFSSFHQQVSLLASAEDNNIILRTENC